MHSTQGPNPSSMSAWLPGSLVLLLFLSQYLQDSLQMQNTVSSFLVTIVLTWLREYTPGQTYVFKKRNQLPKPPSFLPHPAKHPCRWHSWLLFRGLVGLGFPRDRSLPCSFQNCIWIIEREKKLYTELFLHTGFINHIEGLNLSSQIWMPYLKYFKTFLIKLNFYDEKEDLKNGKCGGSVAIASD